MCYKERHSLLLEWFINFLRCMRMNRRASGSIFETLMVHSVSFLLKTTLKFHKNISDFRHLLSVQKIGCWCCTACNERLLLVFVCFLTILGCTWDIRRASNSIYEPCMVHIMSFLTNNNSQISYKISAFGHPLSMGNWMMWYKDRHSFLLECSITFLICIRMVEEVQTLYKKTYSQQHVIYANTESQIRCKLSDFRHPISRGSKGCSSASKDIHCWLSVP